MYDLNLQHNYGKWDCALEKTINVVQPSTSDWASAPVLIWKKDGSVHYCIDYHKLNEQTVKTVATLPLISKCLDSLAGNLWCSTVDWNSGYYQLWLNLHDQHKTAFRTHFREWYNSSLLACYGKRCWPNWMTC